MSCSVIGAMRVSVDFAQQPLDMIFLRIAKAAMRQHRLQAGVIAGAGAEKFCRVRFGAARLAAVVELGGACIAIS